MTTEDLIDIKAVLNKELAEVTIDPKAGYRLDWTEYSPKEYQDLMFRLRNAVNAEIEDEEEPVFVNTVTGEETAVRKDKGGASAVETFRRIVFYIIQTYNDEEAGEVERAMPIYETPYCRTLTGCITHTLSKQQMPQLVWELSHYTNSPPSMVHTAYKQGYIDEAWGKYEPFTMDISKWLVAAISDPISLQADESDSPYAGHNLMSEPSQSIDRSYDFNVYVRFETAEVIV